MKFTGRIVSIKKEGVRVKTDLNVPQGVVLFPLSILPEGYRDDFYDETIDIEVVFGFEKNAAFEENEKVVKKQRNKFMEKMRKMLGMKDK